MTKVLLKNIAFHKPIFKVMEGTVLYARLCLIIAGYWLTADRKAHSLFFILACSI